MRSTERAFLDGQYARRRGFRARANPWINSNQLSFYWLEGWLRPFGEYEDVAPYHGYQ